MMDRFRGPRHGGANSSRAGASTVCQKCLKRGHYSYECKETLQDRPYISRPSRTQQLLNPKLAPKLNTENPNELLQKEGIADSILAKQAEERGRKRSIEDVDMSGTRKHSRSVSSYSSSSTVSTISTNASRSRSRSQRRDHGDHDDYLLSQKPDTQTRIPQHDLAPSRKRRRHSSLSSSSSFGSHSSRSTSRGRDRDRNTRRRHSSYSPMERGRRRSRSLTRDTRSPSRGASRERRGARTRRSRSSSSRSSSNDRRARGGRANDRRAASGRRDASSMSDRSARDKSRSATPRRKLRSRSPIARHGPQAESRSRSRSRSRAQQQRLNTRRQERNGISRSRSRSPFRAGNQRRGLPPRVNGGGRGGRGGRGGFERGPMGARPNESTGPPPPKRERSLSPYSKRLALTQAMNTGGR